MGELKHIGISHAITGYVQQRVPALAGRDVNRETPLLSSGLDSLGILELTMFLSEAYGIELGDEDFQPDHFETVGTLADFVERRVAA